MTGLRRFVGILAASAGAALVLMPTLAAHEIPVDVAVHAFIRPENQVLRTIVRVPLRAMRDVNLPTRGPGFLDLTRADPVLHEAAVVWIANSLTVYDDNRRLDTPRVIATRVSLPSDRSFADYATALAHVTGPPLPPETELPWDQAMLDVLLEQQIESERALFSIRPEFGHLGLRVTTVLRFMTPDAAVRAFEYTGDPGLVHLDPRWHQAAAHFTSLGFRHILDGTDHLLFLLCLLIPFRRLRPLVVIITSFTLAHSITLIASAYGAAPDALWFAPFIETMIAASIVYMALENIVAGAGLRRRWVIAFAFGLVHGFGFSFALRETMQFAGSHLLTSLLFFNLGVELGQLLVVGWLVVGLDALFKFVVAERLGTIILSALVLHTGWHWMTERGAQLKEYDWTAPDAAFFAAVLRGLIVLMLAGAVWWLVRSTKRPLENARRRPL